MPIERTLVEVKLYLDEFKVPKKYIFENFLYIANEIRFNFLKPITIIINFISTFFFDFTVN